MGIKTTIKAAAGNINNALFKKQSKDTYTKEQGELDFLYDEDYNKKRSYKDYRKMLKDPQIKTGINILTFFLLSREMKIIAFSDTPEDKAAADFIKYALKSMKTNTRQLRKNLYSAIKYGFSANEIVYTTNQDKQIIIHGIYPIDRGTLEHEERFKFNKSTGDLEAIIQKEDEDKKITIPIDKVLMYSFDAEFNDPNGESILDALYDSHYVKKRFEKWLAIFIEKHASPTLIGKISEASQAWKDTLKKQLDEIRQGRTNMTIGEADDVVVLESQNKGEAFFKALERLDDTIFRSLFIGNLLLGQTSTGSYAQSQTQLTVTKLILDGIHEEVGIEFQGLFDKLIGFNFENANSPKCVFEKFEDKDLTALLEAIKPFSDDGTLDLNTQWFKEIIASTIKELSGITVDKNNITQSDMDDGQNNLDDIPGKKDEPLKDGLGSLAEL
ncbi:phage Mu protein Gp29-like protein [Methanobrevibacter arboriphilus JCM 13429 = DSM 1125]|uniref:Phage Mu protein Gp29-like protein n=1 Tax=Methanobrevibacter arboriphilus JCM 13429 = DSM 1125 TaxID=1300164 RepID=A0A1V6N2C4_METAZ|nr:DUF935 family protein [Methanobrevibacter arboriphilus]OQD58713.1 phage Mu protein Gp29-like protein [Methanobrevibacter arboriphilus JCM 13429 = DSM 1125]